MRGLADGGRWPVAGGAVSLHEEVRGLLERELRRLRGIRDGRVSSVEIEDVCAGVALAIVGLRVEARSAASLSTGTREVRA